MNKVCAWTVIWCKADTGLATTAGSRVEPCGIAEGMPGTSPAAAPAVKLLFWKFSTEGSQRGGWPVVETSVSVMFCGS